jgi:hypothetical protein
MEGELELLLSQEDPGARFGGQATRDFIAGGCSEFVVHALHRLGTRQYSTRAATVPRHCGRPHCAVRRPRQRHPFARPAPRAASPHSCLCPQARSAAWQASSRASRSTRCASACSSAAVRHDRSAGRGAQWQPQRGPALCSAACPTPSTPHLSRTRSHSKPKRPASAASRQRAQPLACCPRAPPAWSRVRAREREAACGLCMRARPCCACNPCVHT